MGIDNSLVKNKYRITDVQKEKILLIFEEFCQKLQMIEVDELSYDEMISVLFMIGEIYPLLDNVNEWDDYHYRIMGRLKALIESGTPLRLSLYGGLCNMGMAIFNLTKETGYYKRFYDQLNQLILLMTNHYIKELLAKDDVVTHDFDVISGISGITYYLIIAGLEDVTLYTDITRYINWIAIDKKYEDLNIPGWYINNKNQSTLQDMEDYPNGNINYSLSHGIAGPLLVLSLLKKKNISTNSCSVSINRIIEEYKKIGSKNNKYGNSIWPGIIDIDDYMKGNYYQRPNERMSWCYGSIGILRSLYEAAKALDDIELQQYVKLEVKKIAAMNIEDYFLASPILCHGYAGLIVLLLFFYKEIKEECLVLKAKELLDVVLNMYNNSAKLGFLDITYKAENNEYIKSEEDKTGFLDGAFGVVLVLLEFLKEEAFFDKMLLM